MKSKPIKQGDHMGKFPILTSSNDGNSAALKDILQLYVEEGQVIADVTYGKGVFWKDIDVDLYNFAASDIQTGVDFKK